VPGLPIVISDQTEDSDPWGLARFRLLRVLVLTVIPSISTNICPAVVAEQRSFVRAGAGEYSLSWTTT